MSRSGRCGENISPVDEAVQITDETTIPPQSALFAATEATIISVQKSSDDYTHNGRVRDVMIGLSYFGLILNATATFTSFALIDLLGALPFEAMASDPNPDISSGRILLGCYGTKRHKWNVLELQCKVHFLSNYSSNRTDAVPPF